MHGLKAMTGDEIVCLRAVAFKSAHNLSASARNAAMLSLKNMGYVICSPPTADGFFLAQITTSGLSALKVLKAGG